MMERLTILCRVLRIHNRLNHTPCNVLCAVHVWLIMLIIVIIMSSTYSSVYGMICIDDTKSA